MLSRCRYTVGLLSSFYFFVFVFVLTSYKNLLMSSNMCDKESDPQNLTQTLFNSIKILCLINSSRKEIHNRTIHINATWAKRCNKHYFLTFDKDINLPFLDLKIPEIRNELWNKWKAAFKWVYENELENFDYLLRADDDSYFVMENLRSFLLPHNKSESLYFGARFKYKDVPKGYMSGGAGVVLTKSALKQVIENFENAKICPQETSENDDLSLGICAQNLNITFMDTRDNLGHHRMLPWTPTNHFIKGLEEENYLNNLYYPYNQRQRFECCGGSMISFHYVYGEMLYMMEFLIYHTKTVKVFDEILRAPAVRKNAFDTTT